MKKKYIILPLLSFFVIKVSIFAFAQSPNRNTENALQQKTLCLPPINLLLLTESGTETFSFSQGFNSPANSDIGPYDTQVEMLQLRIEDSMSTVFSDDMESGNSGWTADNPWAQITTAYHSPTTCWTDSPGSDYDDSSGLNISLTSPEINLQSLTNATLIFLQRYEIEEDYDYGYV